MALEVLAAGVRSFRLNGHCGEIEEIRPLNRRLQSRAAATANPTFAAIVNLTLAIIVIHTPAAATKPANQEKEEGALPAESMNHIDEVLDLDLPVPQYDD
ncbi:hypothetical protein CSIM01_01928 [Colletotrichum simmondsii]|uniref:Uncharacterized protein n=1 Tax=Colletotrichum simmondsii TaxID=703756 RepID=A0A135SG54_9PEZI|nr:hypothetical protein CSIM01_01928 [Colletotrichum simmondsii]